MWQRKVHHLKPDDWIYKAGRTSVQIRDEFLETCLVNCADEMKTLHTLNDQQKAMIKLIEANFSQTVQYLNRERDVSVRDRDKHHQDAILLRRENNMMKEQLAAYTRYSLSL